MQQIYIFIITSTLGAIFTFTLQKYGFSAVVASCVVGLIGALVGHFFKSSHIPIVVFAGSFVGMTSTTFGNFPLIIIAGVLTGLIYKLSLNVFTGFGGRLGTIAFVSTLISFYVLLFLKKFISKK